MVREGSGVQFTPAAPLTPKEYWASDARLIQADLRFTTERNANVRANTHKIRTERSRPVLTKKGPPIYDRPLEFAAGQWQPTPQAFPTTFLALPKCCCDQRGYGDSLLQVFTPTGTPSLRGLVKVMAELTVEESDRGGLRLRKYRPLPPGGLAVEREEASAGTLPATEAVAAE